MPSATGRPGYRVLTPLPRADGRGWVLVDRGWVPLGATREELPDVAVDARAARSERHPRRAAGPGPAGRAGSRAWRRPAGRACCCSRPRPTSNPRSARTSSPASSCSTPALPDGFERKWRPALGFGPERHLGYAIQWFAFALVTVVLFIALNLRRAGADRGTRSVMIRLVDPTAVRRGRRQLLALAALFFVPLAAGVLDVLRAHGLAAGRRREQGRPDRPRAAARGDRPADRGRRHDGTRASCAASGAMLYVGDGALRRTLPQGAVPHAPVAHRAQQGHGPGAARVPGHRPLL